MRNGNVLKHVQERHTSSNPASIIRPSYRLELYQTLYNPTMGHSLLDNISPEAFGKQNNESPDSVSIFSRQQHSTSTSKRRSSPNLNSRIHFSGSRQKIYGLAFALLMFVYEKNHEGATTTATQREFIG
jgi:hypothetical protein